jgi:hypothetical protein
LKLLKFALLALVALLASLEWQSATITETGAFVSITGFESYPQIGLFLALQVVSIFGSRYWSTRTARVAIVLVGLFSALAITPVASAAGSNSLELLRLKLEKATGISDWVSQTEVIGSLNTNQFMIWGIVVAMSLLVTLSLLSAFNRRAAGPKQQSDWLN